MLRGVIVNIVLLICVLTIAFGCGEAIIRVLGHYDNDGNFFLGSNCLKPYHLPIDSTKEKIDEYLASSGGSFLAYDAGLGWVTRPGSISANGLYLISPDGIRTEAADRSISKIPRQGVLRIAIFGDSFTFGDDVPFENTWGHYLEEGLIKEGINAEVLNFGVPGYGMDQALLRWKKTGRDFAPHVVIFGFNAENMDRNVNLIRPVYLWRAGIPFSKPRYVMDSGELKLINAPAAPPEDVIAVMKDITAWPLVKYEHWFDPGDYQDKLWLRSKLISLAVYFLEKKKRSRDSHDFYSLRGEPAELTLKIIEEFARDVRSTGAKFHVVHLPQTYDIIKLMDGGKLIYSDVIGEINKKFDLADPAESMVKKAKEAGVRAVAPLHYSAAGNKLVADAVCEFMMNENKWRTK